MPSQYDKKDQLVHSDSHRSPESSWPQAPRRLSPRRANHFLHGRRIGPHQKSAHFASSSCPFRQPRTRKTFRRTVRHPCCAKSAVAVISLWQIWCTVRSFSDFTATVHGQRTRDSRERALEGQMFAAFKDAMRSCELRAMPRRFPGESFSMLHADASIRRALHAALLSP